MHIRMGWLTQNCPQELLNKNIRIIDFYDLPEGPSDVPTASSPSRTKIQLKAQKILDGMTFSDDSDPDEGAAPSASPISKSNQQVHQQVQSASPSAPIKQPRVVLSAVNLNERIEEHEIDKVWFFIIKNEIVDKKIFILFIQTVHYKPNKTPTLPQPKISRRQRDYQPINAEPLPTLSPNTIKKHISLARAHL